MKKIISCALSLILLYACKKSTDIPVVTQPPSPQIVTSVSSRDTQMHVLTIDSFEYDSQSRLQSYTLLRYDSSSSPVGVNTSKCVFNYNGSDSMPVSFLTGSDLHVLNYDSQGKLSMDSLNNTYTYYFSYGDNMVYTTLVLAPTIGSFVDTITLENNNITRRNYWFFYPSHPSQSIFNISYSAYANPVHNLKNLGLLLYCLRGKDFDYVSSNLFVTSVANGTYTRAATWNLAGDVVTGGTITSNVTNKLLVSFRYR